MIPYASTTWNKRNLETLRSHGWRLFLTPLNHHLPPGFRFAIDNGAWTAFTKNIEFDRKAFLSLIHRRAKAADFVVLPDIVAAGSRSLRFSLSWIDALIAFNVPLLLPLQDGVTTKEVRHVLADHRTIGLFLGGTTEWKLRTIYLWGELAKAEQRWYHVGRVNTIRRIRLCAEAGAQSFDGTSASRFSVNVPKLHNATLQPSLLAPTGRLGV